MRLEKTGANNNTNGKIDRRTGRTRRQAPGAQRMKPRHFPAGLCAVKRKDKQCRRISGCLCAFCGRHACPSCSKVRPWTVRGKPTLKFRRACNDCQATKKMH
jgi:hypothetical protein